jgi:CRISPR/Cas system CSM-associated protein Csm3 (group 7 of RAMP superfamily)|tara:strand:+ start:323 stop:541 length:219 start_codon:yes stop_codon:yes gene_type:complete
MKITNDVHDELEKIRSAIDDAYNKLNVILYERVTAVKTTYKPSNPSEKITENFSYIAEKLKLIEDSEIVGED